METQLQSMSDYLDLNVIANTQFNQTTTASLDNLYDKAQEEGESHQEESSNPPTHDFHDNTSVDMLYKREPEDDMYIDV